MNIAVALNNARCLLSDAWAAGRKDRLQERVNDYSLPDEVRQFACAIADESHLKAAQELPHVIIQIGPFALVRATVAAERNI